ncbi:MAG: winged helix-turn-helix domain-containing protein [Pyrinomonadaceae bacterium]
MKEQNQQIYSFDNFQLDAGNRQLRRDDRPVSLPAKAFDLLVALVENNGRLVEKDELFTSVWPGQIVEESNLTVYISQIRKALGEKTKNQRLIETVPGYGYRFTGKVGVAGDDEFVIETQTLSRITIEKEEMSDAENVVPLSVAALPERDAPVNAFLSDTAGFSGGYAAEALTQRNGNTTRRRALEPGTFTDQLKTISGRRRPLLLAVIFIPALGIAGGGLFWRYFPKQNNQARSAAIPFADAKIRQLTTGGGNSDAYPTPDSKWIVYHSTRDGKRSLWRIPIQGGEPIQITDKGSLDANVSHDGRLVAFDYKADTRSPVQLALVSLEGGKPVKFFDVPRTSQFNNGIRFTPDDKAVCYRDVANGIWRQDLSGGKPTRLAGLPEEKIYTYGWSRDGKLFAFTRGREIGDAVLIKNSQ